MRDIYRLQMEIVTTNDEFWFAKNVSIVREEILYIMYLVEVTWFSAEEMINAETMNFDCLETHRFH